MCVWLLAACLGVLPTTQVIVNPGQPSPIIVPTTTAATTTTQGRPNPSTYPPTNPSMFPPTNPSMYPPTNPSMYPPSNPSMLPPTNPSMLPPTNPSMLPPTNPSMLPPTNPSMLPPTNPSMLPPTNPSMLPPTNPSMLPPTNPSMLPPTNPSQSPSGNLVSTASPLYYGTNLVAVPIICQSPFAVCVTNPNQVSVVTNPNQPNMGTNPNQPNVGTNPNQSNMGTNPNQPNVGTNPNQPNMGTNPNQPNMGTNPNQPNMGTNFNQPNMDTNPIQQNVGTNPNQPNVGTNPNQPNMGVTGRPFSIDPRLGTTPAYSAPYIQGNSPIIGYSGQIPSSNVNFPRNKRSVLIARARLMQRTKTSRFDVTKLKDHRRNKRQTNCYCVTTGTCPRGTNYGAGLIDFRIVTPGGGTGSCPVGQELCCTGGGGPQTTIACGVTQQTPATAVQPTNGQASFGEFPWQALILTNQNDYIAGGVLVDQFNVLTVVHRLTPYLVSGTAPNVKVRLGEWDAAGTYEPVPYQEYSIRRVFTHPSFNSATLQYDVAVVRLSTPVPITPQQGAAVTINRACLPASSASVYTGQRCMVSGWGKNAFGQAGVYQQILKKVDVPIVNPGTCQTSLQTARLGSSYVLDTTSFICAGGEANKDSCTGDGGSGMVCQVNGQWTVVGLVSWGLGCAMTGVPGVYINVAAMLPWIQQQIATN